MAGAAFTCPNSNPRTQPGKESPHVGEGERESYEYVERARENHSLVPAGATLTRKLAEGSMLMSALD